MYIIMISDVQDVWLEDKGIRYKMYYNQMLVKAQKETVTHSSFQEFPASAQKLKTNKEFSNDWL